MDLVDHRDQLRRAADVAHAPARHGEGLAHAVDGQRVGLHALEGGEGRVLMPAVAQLSVDLVAEHQQLVLAHHLGDGLQILPLHHRAGGVVRVGQNQGLGARGDGPAHVLRLQAEFLLRPGQDAHGRAAGEDDAGAVAHVARLGDQHLVARLQDHPQGRVDGLAGPHRHRHLGGGIVLHAEAPVQVQADLLAQLQQAPVGRVGGLPVEQAVDGRLADVVGRHEIRLAHAQGDDALHGAGQVEETADAAGRHGGDGAVEVPLIIHVTHGEITSRLSVFVSSNTTPSSL